MDCQRYCIVYNRRHDFRRYNVYECLTYSAIAAIFSLVATNIPDIGANDDPKGLICFFAIMIVTILIKEMPLSVGLIVLYNIVNIAAIILSVVINKNIK